MFKNRVVVTGLGMLSPIGNTVKSNWKNILSGKSGIGLIKHFDVTLYSSKIAGIIKNFDCGSNISIKEQKKMDIFIQYGIISAIQAIKDSGLEINESNSKRIGIAIGSGIGV